MNNISITVPLDNYLALTRASDLFHGLAQDFKRDQGISIGEITQAEVNAGNLPGTPSPLTTEQVVEVAKGIDAAVTPAVAPVVPITKTEIPRTDKPDPLSLDRDGIPWDARIHAASQLRLVKDDTWKVIRGIEKKSPGLIEQVRAELLAGVAAGQPADNTPVEPVAVAIGGEAEPTVAPVTATPAAEAFGDPEPVAPVGIDFAGLTIKLTPRMQAKPEFGATITAVLAEFGITIGLPGLLAKPEVIPAVDARLDQLWQD